MNNTWKMLTAGLLTIYCLCGCSLAVEDTDTTVLEDHLVGIFITDYALDLNKLYAVVEKNGSMEPSDWSISFEGVEGEYCIYPKWESEDGNPFYMSTTSDAVCDLNLHRNVKDEGEDVEISLSLYLQPEQKNQVSIYYANPVYQTDTRELYLVTGEGLSVGGNPTEGESVSTALSNQVTITKGVETKTETSSVALTYNIMYRPTNITLCQIDKNHQLVKQDSYEPGKLPKKIRAEKDTAYFIVETEKADTTGKRHIMRDIYTPSEDEDEELETFYPLDNGLLTKQSTEVLWGNQ